VVLVLTGHGLKDGGYAANYHAAGRRFSNAIRPTPTDAALRALLDEVAAARV
jgi:hypothetical protein